MQGVTTASPSLQKSSIKSHGLKGARYQPFVSTYTKKGTWEKQFQLHCGWNHQKPGWQGVPGDITVLAGVLVKRRSSTRQIIHWVGVCPLRKARLGLRSVLHWQTTSNVHVIYIHVRVQSSWGGGKRSLDSHNILRDWKAVFENPAAGITEHWFSDSCMQCVAFTMHILKNFCFYRTPIELPWIQKMLKPC